jgi:hypothetical protein
MLVAVRLTDVNSPRVPVAESMEVGKVAACGIVKACHDMDFR